jgi:type II secretory pathway pseudopilin PulG
MKRHFQKFYRRRAAAMIMALVVLLVVGLISGLTLQAILQSHRQTRDEAQRVQAELLADAALSRAVLMLEKDPNWKGENWTVNLASPLAEKPDAKTAASDPNFTGAAETKVNRAAANPDALRISVTANYPSDPVHRAQAMREIIHTVSPPREKP